MPIKTLSILTLLAAGLLSCGPRSSDSKDRKKNLVRGESEASLDETCLNWGVSEDDQKDCRSWVEGFSFRSQGSQILPLSWAKALETPKGKDLFFSNQNMNSFGWITRPPSEQNEHGLPIGFAIDIDRLDNQAWVGLTCAACHTGVIEHDDQRMLIPGAPGLADFALFRDQVHLALDATKKDADKFDRFASKVLGESDSDVERKILFKKLEVGTKAAESTSVLNEALSPWGPGRIDAFASILNKLTNLSLGESKNVVPANAPTSLPHLWGTSQSDVVQWNGVVSNGGKDALGKLLRNTGEVIGVGADILLETGSDDGYYSTIKFENLQYLENEVYNLPPPAWPEDILGNLDGKAIKRGKELFFNHCEKCHTYIAPDQVFDPYEAVMVDVESVGTDAFMAKGVIDAQVLSGSLEGKPRYYNTGSPLDRKDTALDVLKHSVIGAIENGATDIDISEENIEKALSPVKEAAYKARPLNGIWATAPYLHNGSVPTLYDLLLPAAERPKEFNLGGRVYDPKKVGFQSEQKDSSFRFNTVKPGNTNTGHEYAAELSDDERYDLLEFLKSL